VMWSAPQMLGHRVSDVS